MKYKKDPGYTEANGERLAWNEHEWVRLVTAPQKKAGHLGLVGGRSVMRFNVIN